jgi:hypothetical protein
MSLAKFTARAVIDLFDSLPANERLTFFKLLGQRLRGEDVPDITSEMPIAERVKYSQGYLGQLIQVMIPVLSEAVARKALELPGSTLAELAKATHDDAVAMFVQYAEAVGKAESAKLKDQRDRKPDPETIQRNVEICDLRKSDPKKWSQNRLARKFDVTRQYVQRVLKEEGEWRKLARGN